jgi:hypothetical protein
VAAFVVGILFPLTGFYWSWWETWLGRNLVYFDYVVALALLPLFLHFVFGLTPHTLYFAWVQSVSLALIPLLIVWRAALIYREQRHGAVSEEQDNNSIKDS